MKTTFTTVSLIGLLVSLGGCGSLYNGPEHASTVAERHPIAVDGQTVTMTIDADASTDALSQTDRSRISAFADAYMTNGHGPITVTAPSGSSSRVSGQEAAADVRQALHEAGVPFSAMAGATYRAGGADGDQVVLSYTRYVASASPCGIWTGMKANDYRNIASPNFGCATQNNLAAMIADPRDLVAPQDPDMRDAAVAARGVNAYRDGTQTSSETEDIAVGVAQ